MTKEDYRVTTKDGKFYVESKNYFTSYDGTTGDPYWASVRRMIKPGTCKKGWFKIEREDAIYEDIVFDTKKEAFDYIDNRAYRVVERDE